MKKFKLSNRKKIATGAATVATLAASFAITSSVGTKKADEPTVSELNETQSSNENLEKPTSNVIPEIETKSISSSKAQNVNKETPQKERPSAAEGQTDAKTKTNPKSDNNVSANNKASQNKNEKMFDFSAWNKACPPTLVVVNKDNPIPEDYPLSIESYNGKQINAALKNDLDAMINAAAKDGIKIFIYSGYRTIEEQTRYFKSQTLMYQKQGYSEQDAQAKAAMSVARPRTSEHNTGLAIDFNCVMDDFFKTKEYAWLVKNAAEYGFILRYAKDKLDKTGVIYEPWHFRYVGKEHAPKIMASGLCLEEYIAQLQK